jgi:recombination protein RecA
MAGTKARKATKKKSRAAVLVAAVNDALKLESGVRLGNDPYFKIERIPTGSLVVDRVTGGGFALGRHYELYGDESVGKSYIAYRCMALSQQRGNLCAIVDPEHSFDGNRFEYLGGDPSELLTFHPATAEEAVAVMMILAKHAEQETVEVITCDSVASLVTNDEAAKDVRDEDRMGAQARMMSKALRRITTVNKKTLFLWTNQERMNIGVKFGNPKTTSGGRALRYYATGRIEFRRGSKDMGKAKRAKGGKLVETEVALGRWTTVRVEKDKSTVPYREGAFIFNYEMKRIEPASEIIQLGLEDGLIERNASGWYSYTDLDDHEWKGTEKKFRNWLNTNDDLREEIEAVIVDNTNELMRGGD